MASFAEWTEEQKKKKKKEQSAKGQSFTDYTKQVLGRDDIEDPADIAPVTTTKYTVTASRTTAPVEEDKWYEGWFKESDGNGWEAILGTLSDFGTDFTTGIVGMGEKIVDGLAWLGATMNNQQMMQAAQDEMIFNTVTGNDEANEGIVGRYQDYQDLVEQETAEFIEQDLYDEEAIAKQILSGVAEGVYKYGATGGDASVMLTPEQIEAGQVVRQETQNYLDTEMEGDSVFDEKSDSLVQSAGQLAATTALQSVGVPWWLTTGTTTFGAEAENALKQDATFEEAGASALVTAGAEILTERIAGISFGGKTLTDGLDNLLARNISNQVGRTLVKMGVDATGEGFEEIFSGVISAVGQKLTYADEKDFNELFSSEDALESFIGGVVLSGGITVGEVAKSAKSGVDYVTGFTADEQAVVDKIYQDRLAEEGEKANKKKIYDEVLSDLEKGRISIDTIEEVLGGEDYKAYHDFVESEEALRKEYAELNEMKLGEMTGVQTDRKTELKEQLELLKSDGKKAELRSKLDEVMRGKVTDSVLGESYAERARRGQAFEVDASKYDGKTREILEGIAKKGIVNNTRAAHEFWEYAARAVADRGGNLTVTTTAEIIEMETEKHGAEWVEKHLKGKTPNAYRTADGTIAINVESKQARRFLLGHEITHDIYDAVEATDFDAFKELMFAYERGRTSNEEFEARKAATIEKYNGVTEDAEQELLADLVGEHLYSDAQFIEHLSTKNRNLFQRMWDKVKYLYKMATAGSQEARDLERIKREFERIYRAGKKTETKTEAKTDEKKFSLGYHAGDLGKTEFLYQQGYGRGTGHFGTGTYFVGDKSKISGHTYGARPHHAVEFDNYNLYKVRNDDDGYDLHDQLRVIDGGISQEYYDRAVADEFSLYPSVHAFDLAESKYKTPENSWDDAMISAYQEIADMRGIEYQSAEEWGKENDYPVSDEWFAADYSEYLKQTVTEATEEAQRGYDEFRGAYFKLWLRFGKDRTNKALQSVIAHQQEINPDGQRDYWREQAAGADSFATVFMKSLGYEGVDARGTALDNVQYGSVIYDLKGEDLAKKRAIGTARYSLTDNTGRELSPEQQDYFKDSKMRDDDGNLRVLYHGTPNQFTTFKQSKADGWGTGIYFTDNRVAAEDYGENIVEAYVNITNPYNADTMSYYDIGAEETKAYQDFDRRVWQERFDEYDTYEEYKADGMGVDMYEIYTEEVEVFNQILRELGYDGIIADGSNSIDGLEVVAFNANQPKLTTNTAPTADADIRYSLSAETDTAYMDAVERGDTDTAQMMVDEAAKAAGYTVKSYHGTLDNNFTVFNKEFIGSRFSYDEQGFFFIDRRSLAEDYATSEFDASRKGRVIEAYLKAENPLIVDAKYLRSEGMGNLYRDNDVIDLWDTYQSVFLEDAEGRGADAIILDDGATKMTVVFDPNQIKSADPITYNDDGSVIPLSERFNAAEDDIRYSLSEGGEGESVYSRIFDLQQEEGRYNREIAEVERSDEFKAVEDAMYNAGNVEEGVKRYVEWRETSGYGELIRKRDAVREELKRLRANAEKARIDEGAEAERLAIEKSGLSEADYFRQQAVKEFGYTPYFYDAGYITPNGRMLNFSGEKGKHFGSRGEDHRAIGAIYATTSGTDALVRFMNGGNIRIMAETPGLDITSLVEPTAEQYATIRKFARDAASREYFAVDFSDESGRVIGHYEYEGRINADRVVNDIKYFYQNGKIRESSGITGFLSLSYEGETHRYAHGDAPMSELRLEQDVAPVQDSVQDVAPTKPMSADDMISALWDEEFRMQGYDPNAEADATEEAAKQAFNRLRDKDAPPETEAPYYGESEPATAVDPMVDRDWQSVGDRSVKAFMYEHPDVKPFFQAEANALLGELYSTTKGERHYNDELYYNTNGEQGWYGTKRFTSDEIAYLLDGGISYAQLERGLNAIIEGNGAENNAVSKRIELVISERLLNGYTDFTTGVEIPPNQEYIAWVNEQQHAAEYSESIDSLLADAPMDAPMAETANSVLYNMRDGKNGWGEIYVAAREALHDAVQFTNRELWDAYIEEVDNAIAGNTGRMPIDDAVSAVENDVRQETITPMQGAQLLSDVFNEGGADALRRLYNPHTGNLYDAVLDIAKQIEVAPISEEIAPIAESQTVEDVMPIADAPIAEQYEAIRPRKPKTEKQPRMVRADTGTTPKAEQRSWVGTSTESEAVNREVLPDDLDQDAIHYQPIPNRVTLGKANAFLDSKGYEASLNYFNSQFIGKKITLEDIALGERLIQEAIKRGDKKTAGELIQNVAILGTELGQKVQALSIIKRLTPEGQLRMLQKMVERGKTKGDKAYDGVDVTQDIVDDILGAYSDDGSYDQDKLNAAIERSKQKLADQMGVSFMEKVNAWRYLSMLGNPKTHLRNLVSNVAMRGTVAVKNAIARTIEGIAPIESRTKTWRPATEYVKSFAEKTVMEMQEILQDGGKYSEEARIKAKRKMFMGKLLNWLSNGNSDLLSKEDWWFSKPAFKNAFAEFLTANGIRTEQDVLENPEIVERARQYATRQAEEATFRQFSWLASKINEIEKKNAVTQIAVGAVLPFKKTPINIAKTGLSYSPLGFAKTLTYDIAQVKKGNMDASELVDHLAQNITGTGLTLIGFMLAKAGFLSGGGDDDKEGKYDYQLGEQSYSVNIDGKSYSLSWLSPVAMPLFVGTNAYETLVEKEEWDGDVVMQTLAETLDPLSEMSFLSGLDSVLSSYESGMGKFLGVGESMAQNYVTQFVPTLSSQTATVLDDTKRSTKASADSEWRFGEETLNKVLYKIPLLRNTLEPSTDIWGNELKLPDNVATKALESFIAPYAVRENTATAIDEEIKSLYSMVGENSLLPAIPDNYVNFKDAKYEMSADDFTAYKKTYGQTAYNLLGELFNTSTYRNADADLRADLVKDVYDYARDEAKLEYLKKQGVDYTNATKEGVPYYKENAIKGAIYYDVTPDEYTFMMEKPEKYAVAKAVGGYSAYKGYSKDLYDIKADKDADGKSISGSRKEKVIDYVNSLDIDYGEAIILFKSEYTADDTYNNDIIDYLNGRDDISYDEMVAILKELGFTVYADGTVTW